MLFDQSLEVREAMLRYRMFHGGTWQRRKDTRLATWGLSRWLVLLLVLAISTSGLVHVQIEDHAASAASLSHEIASQGATAEPHCHGYADEAQGAPCCNPSGCSFCVPLTSSAAITGTTVAGVVAALPDEVFLGHSPSPGFRPPALSVNV